MERAALKSKILKHMDDCDVNDYYDGCHHLSPLKIKEISDEYTCSIMGNPMPLYEQGYVVWVSVMVTLEHEWYTVSDRSHILLRNEIDDFISFMRRFGVTVSVWGRYFEYDRSPTTRFKYRGGINCLIHRKSVNDFTINDDFFLKSLYPNFKYKNIWNLVDKFIEDKKRRYTII